MYFICCMLFLSTVSGIVKIFTLALIQWKKRIYGTSRDFDTKTGITWRLKEVECKEDRKLSNRSSASIPDGNKMSRQSGEVVAARS